MTKRSTSVTQGAWRASACMLAFLCAVAFTFWFVVIHGPGSSVFPGRGQQ